MIYNNVQRKKAQDIYDTYFNVDSELCLDFGLIDTLEYYGAISKKAAKKLEKKLEKTGDELFDIMKVYDKKQLKK